MSIWFAIVENWLIIVMTEELESPLMRLRTLRRVSQQHLAEALGVTRQTISNWENGREEPRLKLWQTKALCKVLEISIEDLPDSFAPQPIHNTSSPSSQN
jgi:putative transcriptional regulator